MEFIDFNSYWVNILILVCFFYFYPLMLYQSGNLNYYISMARLIRKCCLMYSLDIKKYTFSSLSKLNWHFTIQLNSTIFWSGVRQWYIIEKALKHGNQSLICCLKEKLKNFFLTGISNFINIKSFLVGRVIIIDHSQYSDFYQGLVPLEQAAS